MTHVDPFLAQSNYRARNDDGDETTATWKAATNTPWTQPVDEVFRPRIDVAETAGGAANNQNYRFEYQLNGSGTWVPITDSTAVCRFAASSQVTDAEPTTQQITSGSFVAGSIVETGATGNISLSNQVTEIEAVLTLVSADVSNNDTITFRLTAAGTPLDAYNATPSLTVSKAVGVTLTADAGAFALTGQAAALSAAALVVENTSVGGPASGTSHVINLPAGVQSGDLLIVMTGTAVVGIGGAGPQSWPAGWTQEGFDSDGSLVNEIRSRVADGTEGSSITITTSAAGFIAYNCYRISGHNSQVEVSAFTSGNSTSPNPASLTPSWGSAPTLWLANTIAASTISAYPTNYNDGIVGIAGDGVGRVASAWRKLIAASEDPGVFTQSAAQLWNAATIAVQPAPTTTEITLTADTGSFALTGQDAAFVRDYVVQAGVGSFTFAGVDVGLVVGRALIAETGSFALTGVATEFAVDRRLVAEAGSFSLVGQPTGLAVDRRLAAETGSFVLAGQDVGLTFGFVLSVDSGAYVLTGMDVGFPITRVLEAETGSFTLTGQAAALTKSGVDPVLLAGVGSFVFTGVAVRLLKGLRAVADVGTFTLTGQDVAFLRSYVSVAEAGVFALTGYAAELVEGGADPVLVAEAGEFVFAGEAVGLQASRALAAESGAFAFMGQTLALRKDSIVVATPGAFAFSGFDVGLEYFVGSRVLTADRMAFMFEGNEVSFLRGFPPPSSYLPDRIPVGQFQRPKGHPLIRAWRTGW